MKRVTVFLLLVAGAINLIPVVGVISAEQLHRLYDISVTDGDLVILMRHRAVLFGLVGAFIVYSAFRPSLQALACVAGLVSMLSFVVIAFLSGDHGPALDKVVIADVLGSICLIAVLAIRGSPGRRSAS